MLCDIKTFLAMIFSGILAALFIVQEFSLKAKFQLYSSRQRIQLSELNILLSMTTSPHKMECYSYFLFHFAQDQGACKIKHR